MAVTSDAQVIVARSEEGNRELVEKLKTEGIPSRGIPTIRFTEPADWSEVDDALRRLASFDWVVFTSPRAVAAVSARVSKLQLDAPSNPPRFAAVGPATAGAALRAGFPVAHVPEEYLTSTLAETLPERIGDRVVLFRTDIAEKNLPTILERRGFEVEDLTVYETRTVEGQVDERMIAGAHIVVFASPSEVRGLMIRSAPEDFGKLTQSAVAACIGPVTAEAARNAGFRRVVEPTESSIDALVTTVKEVLHGAR